MVFSSPAVANGKVFTGSDDGYFYALDADTGDQLWKTDGGNVTDFVSLLPGNQGLTDSGWQQSTLGLWITGVLSECS